MVSHSQYALQWDDIVRQWIFESGHVAHAVTVGEEPHAHSGAFLKWWVAPASPKRPIVLDVQYCNWLALMHFTNTFTWAGYCISGYSCSSNLWDFWFDKFFDHVEFKSYNVSYSMCTCVVVYKYCVCKSIRAMERKLHKSHEVVFRANFLIYSNTSIYNFLLVCWFCREGKTAMSQLTLTATSLLGVFANAEITLPPFRSLRQLSN